MNILLRTIGILLTTLMMFSMAKAEYGLNFPPPVTGVGQDIYDVHMMTVGISAVIMLIVFLVFAYMLYTFRKSRGYEPDQNFHKTAFAKYSWIVAPIFILAIDFAIASKAQSTLDRFWNPPNIACDQPGANPDKCYDINVKIIGHQWWWEYEFSDIGVEHNGKFYPIRIESRATDLATAGEHYLRDVDNPLVLPVGKAVRHLNTSADVLHAWWVPEFGFKRDAIPGYINETWAKIDKEGTYRGQCAELCGTWHAKMPIVVEAVSQEKFDSWVEGKKTEILASLAEASSDKTYSKDELMEKGEKVYTTVCLACHQANGQGMPPAFPPLKDSPMVKDGDITGHIKIVLKGQNAMPPWGHMSDLDLAAVITYERNAWGNDTGDVVQPADVKAQR